MKSEANPSLNPQFTTYKFSSIFAASLSSLADGFPLKLMRLFGAAPTRPYTLASAGSDSDRYAASNGTQQVRGNVCNLPSSVFHADYGL
jgi:hypothetical protein